MLLAKKLNNGAGTPAAPVDAQFNYVTMLLHGDGTNGAQNNTFLDSGPNTFTITRNGNTTQGSFSPFGYNWSNFFDGSADYIQTGNATNLALGTGNFTIEGWFYRTSGTNNGLFQLSTTVGGFENNGTNNLAVGPNADSFNYYANNNTNTSSTVSIPNNTWHHFALVRNSTTTTIYFNGVSVGSVSDSTNYTGTYLVVGGYYSTTYVWNGYISNFRIVKGTAVYTSAFTPPTAPLSAITNTQLLTCQANRFIDSSANEYTLTVSGDTSVQRFNPFGTATAYDSSVIGGSAYLDGTGDYLSLASNSAFTVGTGNVTIEAWIYATSTSSYQGIISGRLQDAGADYPGLGLVINAGVITFTIFTNTARLDDTTSLPQNQWTHVVGVRSGTNMALFVNGVRKASSTNSENGTSSAMNLGRFYPADNAYYFKGYISNARIVKGTAVYDPTLTTLTVPTAPLTAVSGTSLLTRMINGAIFDNAMMNDLETVGNAQISTSVKKYGTGSLYFDGTGDRLVSPPTYLFDLAGNFTIECWVYFNSIAGTYTGISSYADSSGWYGWQLQKTSSNIAFEFLSASAGVGIVTSSSTVTTGVWYHIAVVRSGSTITLYIDGTSRGTSTSSASFSSANSFFRVGDERTLSYPLNGYVDDLRITNGYARYTANFTAPTEALLDTGPY